jgi:vancomycin resistance protein YoaR
MAKQKKQPPESPNKLSVLPKLPSITPIFIQRKRILIITLLAVLFLISLTVTGWILLLERFYPGTTIAQIDVSLLTKNQAKEKVTAAINKRIEKPIVLSHNNNEKNFTISLPVIEEVLPKAIDQAFQFGHTHWDASARHNELNLNLNKEISQSIETLKTQINQLPIDSQLRIENDQINVTPSQEGEVIDEQSLKNKLNDLVNTGKLTDNRLPTHIAYPKLSYQTAIEIKNRLDQIRLNPLQLTFKDKTFTLDLPTLITLIDLDNSDTHLISTQISQTPITVSAIRIGNKTTSDAKLLINKEKATTYFKTIATQIDQEVQEPLFAFDPSASGNSKVKEFKPPVEGQKLQIDQSVEKLSQVLLSPQQNRVELPVEVISPTNKLTNELGIKELIGSGVSSYAGSFENRIFNVSHGASKINGILIPPGEVFSFTKTVGDITAATGYKQAYVIKSGRTVLDDGGGICQVSTTLFRAALNAGLPIVERTAHAYRVSYYEQGFSPGIDATIFYPSVDFKFRNDTPNHILIQTTIVGTSMTVDLYGTSDGRTVELTKPVITSQTPSPPELRQDDPTLPKGTVKQVDWAAAGANVSFKRVVRKDGQEILNETFKSNYRPWQAVYLVGTKEG